MNYHYEVIINKVLFYFAVCHSDTEFTKADTSVSFVLRLILFGNDHIHIITVIKIVLIINY